MIDDAARSVWNVCAHLPVGRRRHPVRATKPAAEMALIREADFGGDLRGGAASREPARDQSGIEI